MKMRGRVAPLAAVAVLASLTPQPASAHSTTGWVTVIVSSAGFNGVYQTILPGHSNGALTFTGSPQARPATCPLKWHASGTISGAFDADYDLTSIAGAVTITFTGAHRGKGVGVFAPVATGCPVTGVVVAAVTMLR